jgi:hypothetical protein
VKRTLARPKAFKHMLKGRTFWEASWCSAVHTRGGQRDIQVATA